VKPIVFLGGGRITSALIAGLRLAKFNHPILVHDRHADKLKQLKRQYWVGTEPDLDQAVASAVLLVVAVRPNSVAELLKRISAQRIPRPIAAVSLAAGIPFSKLEGSLGFPVSWARAMPSPVCRVARGLTALSFGRAFTSASRKQVRNLFSRVGAVVEIPEKHFDAFTVTFSSSHGYHALATLIRAAETIGLDSRTARLAAAHALADAIAYWRSSNLSLNELLEEAATPGGTAAATMESLDRAGYQKIVTDALRCGAKRARQNASQFQKKTNG
jgi:pyrroline-5-carboxylate reductase